MNPAIRLDGLPSPDARPELYRDVPAKRLVAWLVDAVIVWGLWLVLTILSLGLLVWLLPFFAVLDFFYRTIGLTNRSATVGMRLAGIEIRDRRGEPLDFGQAFLHTAGYMLSVITFPVQLVSILLMAGTERRQGLTDMVLGTAALNLRG
ncbi:putative RDD family membrane protein YckC [Hasllibacter halocynthiae]|uniref:Putative RDD family membrane protein YckC n=1 Tax=Hasllibacter halocynthiae TaxID=595589 RepID=A0A2T0X987_9RHOB|nr:RDD family protein [Hasllibacter halocynthiae]PRY95489.1 putative RDD family membrane protein YckC [Hasllibacter halocynthiae]